MIETFVFDFGGVVVDLDFARAVSAFEEIGVCDASVRLDRYRQRGIFSDIEAGRITCEEFCRRLGGEYGRGITMQDAMHGWMGYFAAVDQSRLDFIDGLRRRHRVLLLSNTNPFVMEWADSSAFSPAGRPIGSYFDKLYLSYRMHVLKPDRAIFDMMVADSGIEPSRTLFVDDSEANTAAARALGFRTLTPRPGEDWRGEAARLAE